MKMDKGHWSLGGALAVVGIVLATLQQAAATRVSFLEANVRASQDSVAILRTQLAESRAREGRATRSLGRCRAELHRAGRPGLGTRQDGPGTGSSADFPGYGEPGSGTLIKSIGNAVHWATTPIRWLFGGH